MSETTSILNVVIFYMVGTVCVQKPNPGFCSNIVKNTKYTPWNFLFKNLFEQFRFEVCDLYYMQTTYELLFFVNCYSSSLQQNSISSYR